MQAVVEKRNLEAEDEDLLPEREAEELAGPGRAAQLAREVHPAGQADGRSLVGRERQQPELAAPRCRISRFSK